MKNLINFKNIVGQSKSIRILRSLVLRNIIWKILLFSGIVGTGKKNAAIAFAAACNCENNVSKLAKEYVKVENQIEKADACGICGTCRMVAEGHHPDVIQMDFEGAAIITIADIRSLLNKIAMKPYRSGHKIIITPQADRMSSEAINALVKFLEGYNGKITTILTVSSQMDIMPAILSYCHIIRFKPLDFNTIDMELLGKNDFKPEMIEAISNLSFGNLVKIRESSFQKWDNKRKWLISKVSSLCHNTKDNIDVREWMVLAKILSTCPDTISEYLTIITLWLRDLLIYKLDPKRIYNLDMQDNISMVSDNMDYSDVLNKISIIQTAQQDILKKRGNLRLLIEAMLIQMYELT